MKTPEEILKKHFIPYVCSEEYFKHCLDRKGEFLSIVTQALAAMEEYASQFKYDFSKSCECGSSRIGETSCCNQCGLPVSKNKECEHDFTYFKHKIGRCSKCGLTTEPLSEFEPDDDYQEEGQCDICGLTDDHSIDCPNDNSPFGELIKNGYD